MAGKKKYKIRTDEGDKTAALKKKAKKRASDKQVDLILVEERSPYSKEYAQSEAAEAADLALLKKYGPEAMKSRAFMSGSPSKRKVMGEDVSGMSGGGPVKRNSRDGYARGGLTKVPREDDSTTLMQAGGYLGGLTESGRGTMAGELAPRGSLPVREAGETMYERSKRRRGFKGGGAVSSYNRRYNNQNK